MLESFVDEKALFLLDVEDAFFDAALHDEAPHSGFAGLAQTMDAVDSLVFYSWGPPWGKSTSRDRRESGGAKGEGAQWWLG